MRVTARSTTPISHTSWAPGTGPSPPSAPKSLPSKRLPARSAERDLSGTARTSCYPGGLPGGQPFKPFGALGLQLGKRRLVGLEVGADVPEGVPVGDAHGLGAVQEDALEI